MAMEAAVDTYLIEHGIPHTDEDTRVIAAALTRPAIVRTAPT
jgi:hypothetical protein